jgi:hypothetical protein
MEKIAVSGFNTKAYKDSLLNDSYVEHNGVIAFNPEDFNRKVENDDIKIISVNGLGIEYNALKLGNILELKQDRWNVNSPHAKYDF